MGIVNQIPSILFWWIILIHILCLQSKCQRVLLFFNRLWQYLWRQCVNECCICIINCVSEYCICITIFVSEYCICMINCVIACCKCITNCLSEYWICITNCTSEYYIFMTNWVHTVNVLQIVWVNTVNVTQIVCVCTFQEFSFREWHFFMVVNILNLKLCIFILSYEA